MRALGTLGYVSKTYRWERVLFNFENKFPSSILITSCSRYKAIFIHFIVLLSYRIISRKGRKMRNVSIEKKKRKRDKTVSPGKVFETLELTIDEEGHTISISRETRASPPPSHSLVSPELAARIRDSILHEDIGADFHPRRATRETCIFRTNRTPSFHVLFLFNASSLPPFLLFPFSFFFIRESLSLSLPPALHLNT